MSVSNPASALGEAVGKLIEDELERIIKPVCEEKNYIYDRGGERPEKRKGVKLKMVNRSGNEYQLDGVIESPDGNPILLIESKYLRYKKHNRDKGSWTCAAHYNLRKSHPTIRKSIAVLSGRWSEPSKRLMESFGIELHEVPFDYICNVLKQANLEFNWNEKDQETPRESWEKFRNISLSKKKKLGNN